MKNSIQNFSNPFSAIEHLKLFQLWKKNNLTFTHFWSIRFCMVAALSLLVFTGCESDSDDLLPEEESIKGVFEEVHLSTNDGIFDAANGGTEGFYFLPPMVKAPSYSGTFDAGLSPVVEICETKDCLTVHAGFSMNEGEGSELVRLDEKGEHYIVNWHTDQTGTKIGQTYRIRISVAGTVLGHADVQMAENGKEAKNLTTDAAIALVDGRTLPIKFRIEEGAVYVIDSEGGAFSTNDGLVNLKIPANAIDEKIGITVNAVEDELNDPDIVAGAVFDFGPSPYSFNDKVTLTIKYDPENLPEGVSEDELRLLAVVDGEWVQLPGSSVDVANSTVSGPLDSFSRKGVGRGKVHEITVAPADASIAVEETLQFEAVLTDVDGEVISRKVQWSSSDDAVATVDNSGLTTAVALGEATIEAKSGKATGSANLSVTGGSHSNAFVTKWDTRYSSSPTIALALAGNVDATIDWGDGTPLEKVIEPGPHYHTYATHGVYTVSVTGTVTAYNNFFNGGDWGSKRKLTEVVDWGEVGFTDLTWAFNDAENLLSVPPFSNGLENVTKMASMFSGATSFNSDISKWNTEKVTTMSDMFFNAQAFNANIGSWNTGNVTDMSGMFYYAISFNQDIGKWDTGNVMDMSTMFIQANSFNQDIGNWNTGNVIEMAGMFNGAYSFNQNLSGWNTSKVKSMGAMFEGTEVFNGDIGNWDTGNVTNMRRMFYEAQSFNRDIGNWDTGNVTDMYVMFGDTPIFNQDISTWNTEKVTDMNYMFLNAQSFNQDLSGWCVSGISSEPTRFDDGATSWVLPRPVWGTCPTN